MGRSSSTKHPRLFLIVVQPASLSDETVGGMTSIKAGAVISLRVENLHDGSFTVAGGAGRSVWVVIVWESAHNPLQGCRPPIFTPGATNTWTAHHLSSA